MKRAREEDAQQAYETWCVQEERRKICGVDPSPLSLLQRRVIARVYETIARPGCSDAEYARGMVEIDALFDELVVTRTLELRATHRAFVATARGGPADALYQRRLAEELGAIATMRSEEAIAYRTRAMLRRQYSLPRPTPSTHAAWLLWSTMRIVFLREAAGARGTTPRLVRTVHRLATGTQEMTLRIGGDADFWRTLAFHTPIWRAIPPVLLKWEALAQARLSVALHLVRLDVLAALSRAQLRRFAAHARLGSPFPTRASILAQPIDVPHCAGYAARRQDLLALNALLRDFVTANFSITAY